MTVLTLKVTDASAAQARGVLTDPERCANNPGLRTIAWLILKSERGQTVRQARLTHMGSCPVAIQ